MRTWLGVGVRVRVRVRVRVGLGLVRPLTGTVTSPADSTPRRSSRRHSTSLSGRSASGTRPVRDRSRGAPLRARGRHEGDDERARCPRRRARRGAAAPPRRPSRASRAASQVEVEVAERPPALGRERLGLRQHVRAAAQALAPTLATPSLSRSTPARPRAPAAPHARRRLEAHDRARGERLARGGRGTTPPRRQHARDHLEGAEAAQRGARQRARQAMPAPAGARACRRRAGGGGRERRPRARLVVGELVLPERRKSAVLSATYRPTKPAACSREHRSHIARVGHPQLQHVARRPPTSARRRVLQRGAAATRRSRCTRARAPRTARAPRQDHVPGTACSPSGTPAARRSRWARARARHRSTVVFPRTGPACARWRGRAGAGGASG